MFLLVASPSYMPSLSMANEVMQFILFSYATYTFPDSIALKIYFDGESFNTIWRNAFMTSSSLEAMSEFISPYIHALFCRTDNLFYLI